MDIKIKNLIFYTSFLKKHSKIFIVILILFLILVTTIVSSYFSILKEEETTNGIMLSSSDNVGLDSDSKIFISYKENRSEYISIYIKFKDTVQPKEFYFYIDGWKLKKTETIHMLGVEELYCTENGHSIRYCYKVKPISGIHSFSQSFTCNLFRDRGGDVEFKFYLHIYNIDGSIPMRIIGLNEFNLESFSPEPDEKTHSAVDYIYNPDEERFKDGILLRGSNNYLKRKNEFSYFLSGVIIAVSVAALVTILIELFKKYEEYKSQIKDRPN